MSSCDIVIRSYWRDFDWLAYSLRSIEKFYTGFRDTIVIVPEKSTAWLSQYAINTENIRLIVCEDFKDDYLGQQVSKLYVDQVSDAEFICHLDSDCIFRRPISNMQLVLGGKPICYFRSIKELSRHYPWKEPTENILGLKVQYDFMQSPPFCYPRWLYKNVRNWCLQSKGMSLKSWILSRPPRGFSEFNYLGAYCYQHHPNAMHWMPISESNVQERFCEWYWSWERINNQRRETLEKTLAVSSNNLSDY